MNKKLLGIAVILMVLVFGLAVVYVIRNFFRIGEIHSDDFAVMIAEGKRSGAIPDEDPVSSKYVEYTPVHFTQTRGKKRALYFHAPWCPVCRVVDAEFTSNHRDIPENVVIFKVDYDKETVLKKKYGVTYQHTFVYVDENGEEIKKWNGGGLEEMIENTK